MEDQMVDWSEIFPTAEYRIVVVDYKGWMSL